MRLDFVRKYKYTQGFRLPDNVLTIPYAVPLSSVQEQASCYTWRPEALAHLAKLCMAACVGSVWGLEKEDVDVEKVVWNQCPGLRKAEVVLVVRWPEGDERLDQIVAATSENWKLFRTALETGQPLCSGVPMRGGGGVKTRVSGPVKCVEAWVWDGAVHYADAVVGTMDWMPAKPPGCRGPGY